MGKSMQDIAEKQDLPRTRQLSFYLVLLFLVAPLWSTIPLSWAFVLYSLRSGRIWAFGWQGQTLFAVALCELFFSVYHYQLVKSVSGPTQYGPGKIDELQKAFTRVLKAGLANLPQDGFDEESLFIDRAGSPQESIIQLEYDDPRAADFRNVLRNWFGRVPWSSIRRQEVSAWLYWSIFNTEMPSFDTMPQAHRVVLDEVLDLLEKRVGCKIPEGSAPTIQPIRLTLDKVNVYWRPFAWYAVVGIINWFLKSWLRHNRNVHFGTHEGLEYLIRTPQNWNPNTGPRPIIFMHGLGLGLFQYNIVLTHLLDTFTDRPLLIPLQPHVSQGLLHPRFLKPPTRHEMADRLASLMSKLGWVHMPTEGEDSETSETGEEEKDLSGPVKKTKKGVTMLSHSNGSYTHAWMLKEYPRMVSRSCFVDPVTFCSWEGEVCYNFVYRECTTGMELLMRYFISSELGVANLLQRHFDWSSNALWYEEIPNARDPSKTFFVLGGKDSIVNAERVTKYLRSHGVRDGLYLDPNGRHGQALITGGDGHTRILQWLREPEKL